MRLSFLLKSAALVGAVTTVALIGAVKAIDLDKTRTLLVQEIKAATGRDLTVTGPLELKLGLSPVVVANRVALANAPWGSRRDMLVVERVEAEVALIPLLKRTIVIKRLVLINPDLLLETDARGRANWRAAPAAAAPSGAPPVRLDIAEFLVKNGRLGWRDGADGHDGHAGVAAVHKLSVQTTPNAERLRLLVIGDWQGTGFDLGGTVGAATAIAPAKPWPVQLKGTFAGALMVAEGSIADPLAGKGLDLQLEVQGDELARLLILAGETAGGGVVPLIGPFKLSAHLDDGGGPLRLAAIDAAIGRRDQALVSAKGEIRDLTGRHGIDLRLGVENDNLAGLSLLAGTDLPPIGPIKLTIRLSDDGNGWRLGDIRGRLSDSDLSGELSLDGGKRPHLAGTLASGTFALADLTTPAAKTGEKRPERTKPIFKADGRLLSDDKLPLAALGEFDADITVNAARLIAGHVELDGLAARLRLERGHLTATAESGRLAGGTVSGALTLDATSGHEALLAVRLDAGDLDLGRLMRMAADSRAVTGGPTRLHLDAKTRGDSPRTLMAALGGDLLVATGEARVESGPTDRSGDNPMARLLATLAPEPNGTLRCAVVRFAVRDGIAVSRNGIAAETDRVALQGSGTIDFGAEALDITIAAKPPAGTTRIGGTLAAPIVAIDAKAEAITADDRPCQIALGQTPAKPAAGRPNRRRKSPLPSPGH